MRRVLAPLLLTVFIDLVGIGIVIPVLASVLLRPDLGMFSAQTSMGVRTMAYGILVASYPIAQFFGAPILGALSDQHGRRNLLLLSLFGTFIGYLLFAMGLIVHSVPLLFVSRIIDGFTGGNISIAQSAIADVSDAKSKARNFGLIGMAFGFGFIFGPFIGGKLADPTLVSWFSSSTPFWFAAALTFVNMGLLAALLPETLRTSIATPVSALTGFRNIRKALTLPHMRAALLTVFFFILGVNFFQQFFQVYLIQIFGFTESDIGNIFGFIGLCIALTQGFLVRPASRRFKPVQVLRFTLLGLGLSFPLLLIPHSPWGLYLVLPLIAAFQGLTYPNSAALVSNMSAKDSQGEALGINQSVQSLGMAIPPLIAGWMAAFNPALPIYMASLFLLIGWLVFLWNFRSVFHETFHEA